MNRNHKILLQYSLLKAIYYHCLHSQHQLQQSNVALRLVCLELPGGEKINWNISVLTENMKWKINSDAVGKYANKKIPFTHQHIHART